MKFQNYIKIEDTLTDVETMLYEAIYASKATNEDQNWSERLEKALDEIKGLKEEMIFTFKIEDD